jgi:hypothetical protein
MRPNHDIGDGDPCPTHGRKMTVLKGRRQYCSDQSHDGVWTPEGKSPPTRALWPYHGFEAAVVAHNAAQSTPAELPDLDLGESFA